MKELRSEIYNTLVGKQSITEFEEFLYTNENLLNNLENNLFFYKVMTQNYRSENSLLLLEKEAYLQYDEDFKKVLTIEKSCIEIIKTRKIETYYNILEKIMIDFNYEDDYIIFWEFYNYYNHMDQIFAGYISKDQFSPKIHFFAEKTLMKLQACQTLEEKKAVVFEKSKNVSS